MTVLAVLCPLNVLYSHGFSILCLRLLVCPYPVLSTLFLTSSRSNSHILFFFNLYYCLLKFIKAYRMYMQDNIKIGHQKLAIDYIFSFIKSYR